MGRVILFATTALLLGSASLPALANDIKVPADPVAKAAYDVLEKHCARCHQDGKLDGRDKPSKNFGNVLKLDEIAANPNFVLPGNPFGSKIFKQIADQEMPYDVIYEGKQFPGVSEGELKTLEAWIKSLGAKSAACSARKFVSNKDVIGFIAADLEAMPKPRAKGTRYLTLTHLGNACSDDNAMKVYRQGAIKLVNSLSRAPDVVRLETIDPEGNILRINIDDLGWSEKDWDTVLAAYPYATQPDSQLVGVLQSVTGTKMPYVRADWFAATAARPGLYEKLLKLPNTFQALAKEQGVDLDENIKNFIAQRAGFQRSGVSQNNRLIERHPSKFGYFWTSYDFAGNKGKQSLFEFPLGPKGASAFEHDGGESIFSLPNGFQAYYLNKANGEILAKGPTEIVRDLSRKDLAVTNGISCMGCHDQGMRKAKDDIRGHVLGGKLFPKDIRETVDALYPAHDKMDKMIADDTKRFVGAMLRAGLDPALKLNGVEMVNALAQRYEDDVDIKIAAAEIGMTVEELLKIANDTEITLRATLRRLEQGLIPRDQFETIYTALAKDLGDERPIAVAVAAAPAVVAKPAVKKADLSIISDKTLYKVDDTPVFTVVSARDCFLTITNVDDKGAGSVLFPNRFQQENKIKAGQEFVLPIATSKFRFRFPEVRIESVIAVCTEKNTEVDGIKHNFTRSILTDVDQYTRSVARAIQVEPKKAGPIKSASAERETSRASIIVRVR
jgi:hypothetical protein